MKYLLMSIVGVWVFAIQVDRAEGTYFQSTVAPILAAGCLILMILSIVRLAYRSRKATDNSIDLIDYYNRQTYVFGDSQSDVSRSAD